MPDVYEVTSPSGVVYEVDHEPTPDEVWQIIEAERSQGLFAEGEAPMPPSAPTPAVPSSANTPVRAPARPVAPFKPSPTVNPAYVKFSARNKVDVARMNPTLLGELDAVAGELGFALGVSAAKSDHRERTTSGNRSRHADYNAVDIATINGVSYRGNPKKFTELAKRLHQRLREVGYDTSESGNERAALYGYNDKARGGNHMNHIHVSVRSRGAAPPAPVQARNNPVFSSGNRRLDGMPDRDAKQEKALAERAALIQVIRAKEARKLDVRKERKHLSVLDSFLGNDPTPSAPSPSASPNKYGSAIGPAPLPSGVQFINNLVASGKMPKRTPAKKRPEADTAFEAAVRPMIESGINFVRDVFIPGAMEDFERNREQVNQASAAVAKGVAKKLPDGLLPLQALKEMGKYDDVSLATYYALKNFDPAQVPAVVEALTQRGVPQELARQGGDALAKGDPSIVLELLGGKELVQQMANGDRDAGAQLIGNIAAAMGEVAVGLAGGGTAAASLLKGAKRVGAESLEAAGEVAAKAARDISRAEAKIATEARRIEIRKNTGKPITKKQAETLAEWKSLVAEKKRLESLETGAVRGTAVPRTELAPNAENLALTAAELEAARAAGAEDVGASFRPRKPKTPVEEAVEQIEAEVDAAVTGTVDLDEPAIIRNEPPAIESPAYDAMPGGDLDVPTYTRQGRDVDPSVTVENAADMEALKGEPLPEAVDYAEADAILADAGAGSLTDVTDTGRTIADVRADIARVKAAIRRGGVGNTSSRQRGSADIDFTKVVQLGALYMELGFREVAALSDKLVRHFGEEIRPYMKQIVKEAAALHEDKRLSGTKRAAEKSRWFYSDIEEPDVPGSAESKIDAADSRRAVDDDDFDVDDFDGNDESFLGEDEEVGESRLGAFQRAAFEETGVEPPERKSESAGDWADEAEGEGFDHPDTATRIAQDYLDGRVERFTPAQVVGMGAAIRTIQETLKGVAARAELGESSIMDADRSALLREQLEILVTAGYRSGTEWGREGMARQIAFTIDYSAGGLIIERMRAARRELTPAEIAGAFQDADAIQKAVEALESRETELAILSRAGRGPGLGPGLGEGLGPGLGEGLGPGKGEGRGPGTGTPRDDIEVIAKEQARIHQNATNATLRKMAKEARESASVEEAEAIERFAKEFRRRAARDRLSRRKKLEAREARREAREIREAAKLKMAEAASEFAKGGGIAGANAPITPAQIKAALKWSRAAVEYLGTITVEEMVDRLVKQFGEIIKPHAKEIAEQALSAEKLERDKLFDFERDEERMETLTDLADEIIQIAKLNVKAEGYDGDYEALLDRLADKIKLGDDIAALSREEVRAVLDGRIRTPKTRSEPTTDWQLVKRDAKEKLDQEKRRVKKDLADATALIKTAERELAEAKTPTEKEIARIRLSEARAAARDWRKHIEFMDEATKEFWRQMEADEKAWKAGKAKEVRIEKRNYRDLWRMTKVAEIEMLQNRQKRIQEKIAIMEKEGLIPGQKNRRRLPHDRDKDILAEKGALKDLQERERKLASEIKKKQAATKTRDEVSYEIQKKIDKTRDEIDRMVRTGQLKEVVKRQELYADDPKIRQLRIDLLSARRTAARVAAKLKSDSEQHSLLTRSLIKTKQLVATGDVSFPFNQGATMLWMDQKAWFDGIKATFKGLTSDGYERVLSVIHAHPDYTLADAAGLFEGEGVSLTDAFGAGLEDAPFWSRPFEQSYVAAGEAMRMRAFVDWKDLIEQAQNGAPLSIEQAKELASATKTFLGQGEWGKGTHTAITRFWFAYRYTLSQFEVLGMAPLFRSAHNLGWKDPVTRKLMKKYIRMYATIGSTIVAASYALDKFSPKDDKGRQIAKIERNWRSGNFGRLVVRDGDMIRTVDIMPPAMRILVLGSQFITGQGQSVIGNETGGYGYQATLVGKFALFKTSPLISTGLQAIMAQTSTEKQMFGKTYDIDKPGATAFSLATSFLPLAIQSAIQEATLEEGVESDGAYRFIWALLPIMFRADGFDASALAPLSDKARAVLVAIDYDVNGPEQGDDETDKDFKERVAKWAAHVSERIDAESKLDYWGTMSKEDMKGIVTDFNEEALQMVKREKPLKPLP